MRALIPTETVIEPREIENQRHSIVIFDFLLAPSDSLFICFLPLTGPSALCGIQKEDTL